MVHKGKHVVAKVAFGSETNKPGTLAFRGECLKVIMILLVGSVSDLFLSPSCLFDAQFP